MSDGFFRFNVFLLGLVASCAFVALSATFWNAAFFATSLTLCYQQRTSFSIRNLGAVYLLSFVWPITAMLFLLDAIVASTDPS